MKNAHVRNSKKVAKMGGTHGKTLYTVNPKEAYLVKEEYGPHITEKIRVKIDQDVSELIKSHYEESKVGSSTVKTYTTTYQHEIIDGSPTKMIITERLNSSGGNFDKKRNQVIE